MTHALRITAISAFIFLTIGCSGNQTQHPSNATATTDSSSKEMRARSERCDHCSSKPQNLECAFFCLHTNWDNSKPQPDDARCKKMEGAEPTIDEVQDRFICAQRLSLENEMEVNFYTIKSVCAAIEAKQLVGTPKQLQGCENRRRLEAQGFPMPPE